MLKRFFPPPRSRSSSISYSPLPLLLSAALTLNPSSAPPPSPLPSNALSLSCKWRTYQLQCSQTPSMQAPCESKTSLRFLSYTCLTIWFYSTCVKQFLLKLQEPILFKNPLYLNSQFSQKKVRRVNFTKEFHSNEICASLKNLLKNGGGFNLKKPIPLNENSEYLKTLINKMRWEGIKFTKLMLLNEIPENPEILLKEMRRGQFYKRNPFKQNFLKISKFCPKKGGGGQFH